MFRREVLLARRASEEGEVRQLETFVRQSREVRTAEDERRPLGEGDEMQEVFAAVAKEVEDRLPMFCTSLANDLRGLRRQASRPR